MLTKGKSQTLQIAVVQEGDAPIGRGCRQTRTFTGCGLEAAARKVSGARRVMVSWRNWSANRRRPSRPIAARSAGSAASRRIAWLKPVQVARLEQDAGLGEHDLAGAVDVVADHRAAHQQRLRQDPGQPLAQAGMDHGVDGAAAARGCGRAAPAR